MKILRPQFEIWHQGDGLDGVYRQIERAGRVCYKSEKNTTSDSARPFVGRMIQSEHTAMLEHGTVYLTGPEAVLGDRYCNNKFSKVNIDGTDAFVTTNLRVIVQNKWDDDLKYISVPTEHHELRVTVHFTTQVAITREYNRHRSNSMAEQSTRYCNYSKDKFGSEISVNLPEWIREESEQTGESISGDYKTLLINLCRDVVDDKSAEWSAVNNWLFANLAAELAYMNLISMGRKPQEARVILPLDCNTELVHTAFVSDWIHFFNLRALGTTGAPHPDAKILAMPLYEEFRAQGLIK